MFCWIIFMKWDSLNEGTDLFKYLSYDFINNNKVGVKKRSVGNIEIFLYLIIKIGKMTIKKNTRFIE